MITGFESAGHKKLNANKVNVCKDEKNNHSFTYRKIKKGLAGTFVCVCTNRLFCFGKEIKFANKALKAGYMLREV